MTFATLEEALECLDDWAADNPLEALREFAECLSDYRLDACALAEPAAALIYAYDRLMPERQRWCIEAARQADLQRFIPDRLIRERRIAIARARGLEP
jgi:hypothetical protein